MSSEALEVDFAVIGGGLAGTCAAIAAARQGLRVALLNNRPVLGGNSSSEIRVWVCGATAHGNQRWARETGIIGELLEENQYRNPEGNPVFWDQVILDAVRRENNIRLLLNTDVRDVTMSSETGKPRIASVTGWTIGSEIETSVTAHLFADCTGDGSLGAAAGATFRVGKEARAEFGEDFAPDAYTREFMGSTILFHTKDAGEPVLYIAPDCAKDITQTPILETRSISAGDNGTDYWWIEYGGHLDPVADDAPIAHELRSVIFGIWDYIKNSGKFDADNLTLEWIGHIAGKREYRRFIGDHVLTESDVLNQVAFPDAVAFGGWSVDLHPVEGMYAANAGAQQRFGRGLFHIPFRSLYSKDVDNLLFAGRNISATHVGMGATRVMATCAAEGEAIGTAAALAVNSATSIRDLAANPAPLQQRLLREDAPILGLRKADPEDLVGAASVSSQHTAHEFAYLPAANPRWWSLDVPTALTLPGRIENGSVLSVFGQGGVSVHVSLHTSDSPLAVLPSAEPVATTRVQLPLEPGWVDVDLRLQESPTDADKFVVFDATAGASLAMSADRSPLSLALARQVDAYDQNVWVDDSSPLLAWSTKAFSGRTLALKLNGASPATDESAVAGGFQRPFGGPNMWLSRPLEQGAAELYFSWETEQEVGWMDLVFDSELDVELNSLNHHRTPERVMPGVIRDFAVAALGADGSYCTVATVTDNRRRHCRLKLKITTTTIRLTITATNGAPEARVVSVRVYQDDTLGADVSYATPSSRD